MRPFFTFALIVAAVSTGPSTAQPTDQTGVRPVTVELSNFKFTPSDLSLSRGVTYRIHFVNTASGGHNFVAKEFFDSSSIAPDDRAKVTNGRVELDDGQTVDVTLTPGRAGKYKVHCSHFMHSTFGMTGTITVE